MTNPTPPGAVPALTAACETAASQIEQFVRTKNWPSLMRAITELRYAAARYRQAQKNEKGQQ